MSAEIKSHQTKQQLAFSETQLASVGIVPELWIERAFVAFPVCVCDRPVDILHFLRFQCYKTGISDLMPNVRALCVKGSGFLQS